MSRGSTPAGCTDNASFNFAASTRVSFCNRSISFWSDFNWFSYSADIGGGVVFGAVEATLFAGGGVEVVIVVAALGGTVGVVLGAAIIDDSGASFVAT